MVERRPPRGPFGFPRLTSIGPLVTDGGEPIPEVGDMALDEDTGDVVTVTQVFREKRKVDIRFLGEGASHLGMATRSIEEFNEKFEIV